MTGLVVAAALLAPWLLLAVPAGVVMVAAAILVLQQRELVDAVQQRSRGHATEVAALRVALTDARDRADDELAGLRAEMTALRAAKCALESRVLAAETALRRARPARHAGRAVSGSPGEWSEVWPDLGDGPTVVDLLTWEARAAASDELGDVDAWRRRA